MPQGLTATHAGGGTVSLAWQQSTSDNAPVRYRVFRNGRAIGTKQTALTYTDQLAKGVTARYQVRAIDSSGAKSALSPSLTFSAVKWAPAPSPRP